MTTNEFFYPGFEHAGLETPYDRVLTWTLCTVVLAFCAMGDAVHNVVSRVAPRLEPQFDA